jgi:hypothetical protein
MPPLPPATSIKILFIYLLFIYLFYISSIIYNFQDFVAVFDELMFFS